MGKYRGMHRKDSSESDDTGPTSRSVRLTRFVFGPMPGDGALHIGDQTGMSRLHMKPLSAVKGPIPVHLEDVFHSLHEARVQPPNLCVWCWGDLVSSQYAEFHKTSG